MYQWSHKGPQNKKNKKNRAFISTATGLMKFCCRSIGKTVLGRERYSCIYWLLLILQKWESWHYIYATLLLLTLTGFRLLCTSLDEGQCRLHSHCRDGPSDDVCVQWGGADGSCIWPHIRDTCSKRTDFWEKQNYNCMCVEQNAGRDLTLVNWAQQTFSAVK